MPTLPIVTVVGYSNAGKTRCIVELITRLTARGYRVATIKHCHDGFTLDTEGKDTWKHKQAGATTTVMASRNRVGVMADNAEPLSLTQLCEQYVQAADIVLAEGFSWEAVPKILVVSQTRIEDEKLSADAQLIALVNGNGRLDALPQFSFDEMDALATLLEQTYLLGAHP